MSSDVIESHVACRCLNVQVSNAYVAARGQDDVELDATGNGLKRDVKVCLSETRKPTVHIAQAPLTSRVSPYTLSSLSDSLTALVCVNCDTFVYAVDKIYQPKSSRNARSTGFNIGSSSTGKPAGEQQQQQQQDETKLLPEIEGGSMWLLKGCIYGSEAIRTLSSSEHFSKSFKLLVHLPIDRTSDANRTRAAEHVATRKDPSPSRTPLPFLPATASHQRRSAASPSPSRRRTFALAEHEEEQGDDLDTLHLLETLLPHVPASLTNDARMAYVNGDQSVGGGSGARKAALQHDSTLSQSYRSPDKGGSSKRYFDSLLDEQGTATLRNRVRDVQRELYELLKLRSQEIAQEQEKLRKEAQHLAQKLVRSVTSTARRDAATSAASPRTVESESKSSAQAPFVSLYGGNDNADGAESTSPTVFVRRRPYVPAMEKTASQDSNASRRVASGSSAIGVPGREGPSHGQGIPNNVGSYLSASFAMRGRDLPGKSEEEAAQRSKEEEEDWFAQKKRLRERYPHADHSALPSAVNSDDEESVAVKVRDKDDSSDSEQDQRRGRERGRQSAVAHAANAQKTPTPPRKREKDTENGRGKDAKQQAVRTMLGSDTSGSFGEEATQAGKAMRGALKRASTATDEQRPTASTTEKKVAFASTNQEHNIAPIGRAAERSPSPHEPIGPGEAVFEIDEDLLDDDADDDSPTSSDITIDNRAQALEGGKDQMIQDALMDEMARGDVEHSSETAEELATDIKNALPIAGSFSVLAETQSRRASLAAGLTTEESALNFDPASFRFDGRTVYASGVSEALPATFTSSDSQPGGVVVEPSVHVPSASSSRSATKTIRNTGMPAGDRLHGSAIGFRVAVGEAEARLSGVLAPHAPSHRGLYAAEDKRKRGRNEKYALKSLEEEGTDDDDDDDDDDADDDVASKAEQASHSLTPAHDGAAALASSVPANAQMIRRASSALQHDPRSGFILEPKTSLPYREKMLTPSLRKAMRAQAFASNQHRPSLATLSDTSDNTVASGSVQQVELPGKNKQPAFQYSVPASVTRGFEASGMAIEQQGLSNVQANEGTASAAPVVLLSHSAVLAAATATAGTSMSPFSHSVQSSPMLGSSAGTGRSSRQRSPRPPYVQPPPPSTTDLRLTPDAEHRPQSISLAKESVAESEDDIEETLRFFHTLENLKTFKRTGWFHHRIERPESIADHMYRMAVLSLLLPDDLDIGQCVKMCIVHDLAEALVGDLTPLDGVSREEKLRRERDAIQHLVYDQLDGSEVALRIESIWNEYEDRMTNESKAVKDLDRFELALQAVEYERRNKTADLQPFYTSAKDIQHPRVRSWMLGLAREREHVWKGTEYAYKQEYPTTTAAEEGNEGDETILS